MLTGLDLGLNTTSYHILNMLNFINELCYSIMRMFWSGSILGMPFAVLKSQQNKSLGILMESLLLDEYALIKFVYHCHF